jgi:sugar transferase EpsL
MKDQKVMHPPRTFYAKYGKRWFDLALTLPGFIAISPVLMIIAIMVKMWMGSPVLFCQQRPGMNEVPFHMFKFRTMTNEWDEKGKLLPDKKRLTKLGRFLRSTSLDELPELLNVLKGNLSLVGPRPLLMQYLDRYTPEQARRHEVKPGVTGWAQVNGRNAISWEDKFKLDVWYVDHQTFCLDIRILLLTMGKVFRRDGISAHGEATMGEFGVKSEQKTVSTKQ